MLEISHLQFAKIDSSVLREAVECEIKLKAFNVSKPITIRNIKLRIL